MSGEAFDLDAAAAAQRGEGWAFTFHGERFELPAGLPLDVLEAYSDFADAMIAAEGDTDPSGLRQMAAMRAVLEAFRGLFASDADYERFRELRPTQVEMQKILEEVARRGTGASLGEASAPPDSSGGASNHSPPTSLASTGST